MSISKPIQEGSSPVFKVNIKYLDLGFYIKFYLNKLHDNTHVDDYLCNQNPIKYHKKNLVSKRRVELQV